MPWPCFKKKLTWQDMQDRSILSNTLHQEFKNNEISTTKYNCITFIPKNMIEQFSKVANLYFLVMGLLQMINEISASDGVPTTYFPLSVIIFISALKDLYEDYKRHKSDNEENNKKVELLTNEGFKDVTWKSIRVGNIVKVKQDEFFCADLLVIKSSGDKGNCFIETKNLDGETNLKHKKAHQDFGFLQKYNEHELFDMKASFDFEHPNPYLYTFTGTFKFGEKPIPLDSTHFILRGCSLRNTKFVIGLVAYTGHDTKIMLNSVKARPKYSKVEIAMNRYIITVFVVQQLICIFSALYYSIWYVYHKYETSYLVIDLSGFENNAFVYNFFVRFGSWLIIFQNFVPISLIVTLEMVKFIQGSIIAKDEKLKHQLSGTYVTVQTSNLNEELGQIEYVFSDKTGTLTCNIMEFKCFSVGGVSYGDQTSMSDEEVKNLPDVTNVYFRDRTLFMDLEKGKHMQREALIDALFCLSLCHTIITEEKGPNDLIYNASSPDELALVNFAKYVGFYYFGTDNDQNMLVKFNNQTHKFKLLQTLEFNSTRKRQSVILKTSDNRIVLYTKGADSIIEKRLRKMPDNDEIKVKTWNNLERYASDGLRTLLLAKREISQKEYDRWADSYLKACTTMVDREKQMENVQEEIESGLILLGATAIEDRLQDEVGETITNLREAGLKVWVLTGDKIETAINIGFSCKLLNNEMERIVVDGISENEVSDALDRGLMTVRQNPSKEYALVLSGDALIHGVKEYLSKQIVEISDHCKSVIACRVSPKQKQEVVSLVRKEKPRVSTLAIGDGANDVNMITAAHVGIGIKGVEGQQAARSSDYAVGEFKTLRRLLLYYGRESYRKNSILICYNFFKNMILVVPQFWYGFFNGFSGQSLYDSVLFQFYNMFYTALPIIIYALYDKEHKGRDFISNPEYYSLGLKNQIFTRSNFWLWIIVGVWQALLNCFSTYYIFTCITSEEYTLDFWAAGMTVYGSAIIIANVKILLFSNTYSVMSVGIIFGSILFYYSNYVLESHIYTTADVFNSFERTFNTDYFYMYLIYMVVATSLLDLAYDKLKKQFTGPAPEIAGFVEMKDLEVSEIRPSIPEVKHLPNLPSLKRQHTGYAFSQEDPTGYLDSYYKNAQN